MEDIEEVVAIPDPIEEYYKKPLLLSYSAISLLLYSPRVYAEKYIYNLKEENTSKNLLEGSVIHLKLLTPELFDQKYIVSDVSLPGESVKKCIDYIFKNRGEDTSLDTYDTSILAYLHSINLHQSLKDDKVLTGDEKRLAKVKTPEALNYWNFLINAEGKEVIDTDINNYCDTVVSVLKEDVEILNLLGLNLNPFDLSNEIEVFNEHYLEIPSSELRYPFGFKGYIDNLKIDHKHKKIIINDFKTTGKELTKFKESVEFYNYWIQAIIYIALVNHNYNQSGEYTIEFNFLVIDSYQQYYVFSVKEATINAWLDKFDKDIIPQVIYHYNNKDFTLPYLLATKQLVL